MFFLAVAVLGLLTVGVGVTNLYEAPGDEFESNGEFGYQPFPGDDDADYNRNLGLILGAFGAGSIVVGLLALGSRLNPLRCGLLAGGVGLAIWGVIMGSQGSNDWLTIVTSGIALAVLLYSANFIDEGIGLPGGPAKSPPPSTGDSVSESGPPVDPPAMHGI